MHLTDAEIDSLDALPDTPPLRHCRTCGAGNLTPDCTRCRDRRRMLRRRLAELIDCRPDELGGLIRDLAEGRA